MKRWTRLAPVFTLFLLLATVAANSEKVRKHRSITNRRLQGE